MPESVQLRGTSTKPRLKSMKSGINAVIMSQPAVEDSKVSFVSMKRASTMLVAAPYILSRTRTMVVNPETSHAILVWDLLLILATAYTTLMIPCE
jgi:hypothetical protein